MTTSADFTVRWNPFSDAVAVGKLPGRGAYRCAVTIPLDGLTAAQRAARVFVRAWHLVFAEGIPPEAVHKAFSHLPEYRANLDGYLLEALRMKSPAGRQ